MRRAVHLVVRQGLTPALGSIEAVQVCDGCCDSEHLPSAVIACVYTQGVSNCARKLIRPDKLVTAASY